MTDWMSECTKIIYGLWKIETRKFLKEIIETNKKHYHPILWGINNHVTASAAW